MTSSEYATVDMMPAEEVLESMGTVTPDMLIPLLQKLHDAYGYLPPPVLTEVSSRTGIPISRMYGVITFYEQFHTEPRGRHMIRCCRGTACHVRGGAAVIDAIKNTLGIGEGETSDDLSFTFETVACLGACALAPVVVIDGSYHGKVTPAKIETILQRIRQEDAQ